MLGAISIIEHTFTAAWWCVRVWSGLVEGSEVLLCAQIFSTLSLPPLANSLPSGDHSRPHTSWLWPRRDPMWCDATLTSWWWIAPLREPLREINFPFSVLGICNKNFLNYFYTWRLEYSRINKRQWKGNGKSKI